MANYQMRKGAAASVKVLMQGGDPLYETTPEAAYIAPFAESLRRAFFIDQANTATSEYINMEGGPVGLIRDWWKNSVEAPYREKNDPVLGEVRPGMTEIERYAIQRRLQPVITDPNQTAEMRSMLFGEVDAEIKARSHGMFDVLTHPATRNIANFINRETAIGTPGYLRSGDQPLPALTEFVAQPAAAATGAMLDPIIKMAIGAGGLVGEALDGISGGAIGWEAPTNFIETEDGQVLSNAGDIPGFTDLYVSLWGRMHGRSIEESIASWDASKEHAWASSHGFGQLVTGVASVAGMLVGYAPTALAGAKAAQGLNKGLRHVGALGKVGKGMKATKRAKSIMFFTGVAGQTGAFALQEGLSTGSSSQFATGLQHGAMTGLVMSVLGGMGRGVERLARTRKSIPPRAAQALGHTTEALGFTGLEIADMEGSLWEFIKSPTAETWEDYALAFTKNWIGLLLGKGMGARLGEAPRGGELLKFTRATIEAAGERIRGFRERGEELPADMVKDLQEMGTTPEEVEAYSMAAQKGREGDVESAVGAAEQYRNIKAGEGRVGRSAGEEAGKEMEDVAERPEPDLAEKQFYPEEGLSPKELAAEVGRVREMPNSVEKRKRIIELQVKAQGMMSTAMLEGVEKMRRAPEKAPVTEVKEPQLAEGELGSIAAEKAAMLERGVAGTEPVKRRDIFARQQGFEGDPVRTPQRKGKIAGTKGLTPSTKGFLDRNKNLIRYAGDAELAERAHEFSHSVQEAAIGDAVLPPRADAEAKSMLEGYALPKKASPERVFAETWAEYFARDQLGDNVATLFPQLTKLFKPMMARRPGVLKQYTETKDLFERYILQGEYGRQEQQFIALGEKPSPEVTKALRAAEGGPVTRMRRRVTEWMFNDIESLEFHAEKWAKIAGVDLAQLPIQMNIMRTLESLRATEDAKTATFVGEGIMRRREGGRWNVGQSLKDALEPIKTLDHKRAFMVALGARKNWEMARKNEQAIAKGEKPKFRVPFAKESSARVFKEAADRLDMTTIGLERIMRKTKRYFDDLIYWARDQGMLSSDQADRLVDEWSVYVPFQRYYEGAMKSGLGVGGGLRGRVKGGGEEIADPFEAMVQVTRGIVRQVHRHKAIDSLYKMGKELKGMGGLVFEIPADRIPIELKADEMVKALESQISLEKGQQNFDTGIEMIREALGEEAAVSVLMFRQSFESKGGRPIVIHRTSEGKRVWLELDKGVYEAIQTIEGNTFAATRASAALATFANAARVPAALVRYFATGVNLSFAARNMFRDAALFPGYSKVSRVMLPYAGIFYWARGVSRLLTSKMPDSKLAQVAAHYRQVGGDGFGYYAQEIKRLKGSNQLFNKEARTPRGMIERTRDILDQTVGKVIDVGERALRFEEFVEVYKKALKRMPGEEGAAALEALEASKEVTINFTRAGVISRELNKVIPYFNAGMQGQRKIFRSFLGFDGKRAQQMSWVNLASTMGTMTALQYLFHGDEDWFQDLRPWQKFYAWHFDIGGDIIQIPVPHLAGTTVVGIMDQLFAENKMKPTEVLGEFLDQTIFDHFTAPSFMLPIAEWTANYSFWRDRPIVPDWMERERIGPLQYNAYTKGYAKWASQMIYDIFGGYEVSPMKIENAVNSTLGGMPNNIDRTIGGIGNALGAKVNDEQDDALDQIPVLNSLFRHFEHKGGRTVNDFWEEKANLDRRKDPAQQARRDQAARLAERMGSIDDLRRAGVMTKEEAARAKYEVALPFVIGR